MLGESKAIPSGTPTCMRRIATLRMCAIAFALAVAFACASALPIAAQPAWANNSELAPGTSATEPDGTVSAQETVHKSAIAFIFTDGITSGDVSYNPTTKVLTIANARGGEFSSITANVKNRNITVKLVGTNSFDSLYLDVATATIQGSGTLTGDVRALEGSVTIAGGTVSGLVSSTKGSIAIKGGTVNGAIGCSNGRFNMFGGKLTQSKGEDYNIINASSVMVKKGSILSTNSAYGIHVSGNDGKLHNFTMTGGAVKLAGTNSMGISIHGGNLVLKGGSLQVTGNRAYSAISVGSAGYDNSTYGGKVQVTGGTLRVTSSKPSRSNAIFADSMSCKMSCLRTVAGKLPVGTHFLAGKSEYAITKYDKVSLIKYNGTSKKPAIQSVTFGQYKYRVGAIAANAFNTRAGQTVTDIIVGNNVMAIANSAFANTKALKKLTFNGYWWKRKYSSDYSRVTSVKVADGYSIAKKAFSKCGKSGGRELVVVFHKGIPRREEGVFRSLLISLGMGKSVGVKTLGY